MQPKLSEKKPHSDREYLSEGEAPEGALAKERRSVRDRRKHSLWPHINPKQKHRRRYYHRREGDQQTAYLDRYNPVPVGITLCVVMLSCLDATFTLTLLQRDSVELNPVMAWLINFNPHLFVAVKLALTGTGLILLLAHTHFRVFGSVRVVYLLYISLLLYCSLTIYELILLDQSSA